MADAPTPIQTLFSQFGTQLVGDAFGNVHNLLSAFFTNVKANPTPQNVAAQGAILTASALLQLPNLEQQAISQAADTGTALLAAIKPPTV